MQITLNQTEIEKAIIAFVGNQGISITGSNVTVALTAGRGPNGVTATIDISNEDSPNLVGRRNPSPVTEVVTQEAGAAVAPVTFKEEPAPFEDGDAQAAKPLFGS